MDGGSGNCKGSVIRWTSDDESYTFGLPGITSVFTAELLAINKALNIVSPNYRSILICSDSYSAFQALENFYSKHPVVIDCRKSRREEVVLCRLRLGHTRITHEYLMSGEAPPLCTRCNCRMTVHHILREGED
ncbi:uncharacterized protein LOC142331949 [Lycorma delicatula]|uniref:uncharacterized protein LOC142331949 n=1 Tax=Lycorma delicatula TaxID=130591 RepID=UPI003F511F99